MKTQKQGSALLLLQNAQLREWNNNKALELQTRYDLEGKHKEERGRLVLEGATSEDRIRLLAKHALEKHQLNQYLDHTRKLIEQRHAWEKILLKQQYDI